jgi:predicted nuclease of predicted toxin-antitoxin system
MRFLVDAQLPPAMVHLLVVNGHDAQHVADVGLRDATDAELWRYAIQHDAVILTKDEDFPHRLLQGGPSPVVVWLRIGNTSRRALLEWFEPILSGVVALVEQGERLVEVRSSPRSGFGSVNPYR